MENNITLDDVLKYIDDLKNGGGELEEISNLVASKSKRWWLDEGLKEFAPKMIYGHEYTLKQAIECGYNSYILETKDDCFSFSAWYGEIIVDCDEEEFNYPLETIVIFEGCDLDYYDYEEARLRLKESD